MKAPKESEVVGVDDSVVVGKLMMVSWPSENVIVTGVVTAVGSVRVPCSPEMMVTPSEVVVCTFTEASEVSDCRGGITVVVSPLGRAVSRVVVRLAGIVTALLAFEMTVLPSPSEVDISISEGVMVITSPLLNVAVVGSESRVARVTVPPASSTTV